MIFLNPLTELVPLPLQAFIYAGCGLAVGSFLNVLIYRLPPSLAYKGEGARPDGLCVPSSKCPSCLTPLLWYHNIPVFSFVFLRAKCAFCGARISWRYPVIELVNAGLWGCIWFANIQPTLSSWTFGFSVLGSALLAIAMMYWDWSKEQSDSSQVIDHE